MKKTVAEQLLNIHAVSLSPSEPFTWSSGIKSPIYCDNRLTLSYPAVRREIAASLKAIIKENYPDAEVIAGTATAGIPHAAWVSELLDLPMVYVRSKAKGHGKGNQIEGIIKEGQKVVIIEDLISTGGSVINAAEAIREAGAEVIGVAAIFTYELEKGSVLLEEAGLSWQTITNFSTLVEVALEQGIIQENQVEALSRWQKSPESDWFVKQS
ncbi:orotate phosphoribosyltransferase [Bacillus taeanensis]|uniref:Orotate phosphoribosyltransferase n=1 Tax=Bacillus taeanensis TaxID=273032 RepID=A0A366XMI5_9BACI|nr:orotate phosphoribosyltransferase [Bacillus taeanensis]RBW67342.1 orotate phosphoribosyltransferase [Bacillus taeanensis]